MRNIAKFWLILLVMIVYWQAIGLAGRALKAHSLSNMTNAEKALYEFERLDLKEVKTYDDNLRPD